MKTSRNLVAAVALLAVFAANPALAGWGDPIDTPPEGNGMGTDEMVLAAQWGFQIAQAAL